MRCLPIGLLLSLLLVIPLIQVTGHSSTSSTALLTGLDFPVSFKFAPDGRIFYNEKNSGNIRIVLSNMTLLPTPFATITPLFNQAEAGLLGIALDPMFAFDGYVYLYYTYQDASMFTHGHIRRYTASGNVGTSPVDIFDVTSSAAGTVYHNGGYIKFGPDGKLYAQVGEFHQSQQSQNQGTTDGKMLRMNTDGTVPTDNPFPGSLAYALGIRNAFGFDFDQSNNRLIATEAGPNSDDEVNIIVKGGNYGWPTCTGPCHNPSFIDPIIDLNPVVTPTGIATASPNVYYFGEWNTGNLVRLDLSATGSLVSMSTVYTQTGGIIGVEKGPDGKLYYSSQDALYSYDLQGAVPMSPRNPVTMTLVLIIAGVAVGVSGLVIVAVLSYRKKRGSDSASIGRAGRHGSTSAMW